MDLGARLKAFRKNRHFTMEVLSERANVSKSMISKIERGDVQPTIEVAARIAKALGTHITNILEPDRHRRVALMRSRRQPVLIDERTGIIQHVISPVVEQVDVRWLHVTLPASTQVTSFNAQMKPGGEKYLYMLKGELHIYVDDKEYRVKEGDSFKCDAEFSHQVENKSQQPVEYFLLLKY